MHHRTDAPCEHSNNVSITATCCSWCAITLYSSKATKACSPGSQVPITPPQGLHHRTARQLQLFVHSKAKKGWFDLESVKGGWSWEACRATPVTTGGWANVCLARISNGALKNLDILACVSGSGKDAPCSSFSLWLRVCVHVLAWVCVGTSEEKHICIIRKKKNLNPFASLFIERTQD